MSTPIAARAATPPSINGALVKHQSPAATAAGHPRLLLAFAWLSTLVSLSVYGFWRAVIPGDVDGLQLAQVLLVAALLVTTWVWPALRPVRGYVAILLAIHLVTNYLHPFLAGSTVWRGWFNAPGGPWLLDTFGDRLLKLAEALVVIAVVLFGLRTSRRDAFLARGQLDAPARRVRWLGMRTDQPWTRFGVKLALILGGLFGLALVLMMSPSVAGLLGAVPRLPIALAVAAMNALYEEVLFRAAPLSQLLRLVGGRQAILITTAYFGLGHFSGSIPSGPVGVLQASSVGWLLSKSMLETRGLAWPWFIHFVLDAVIFCFLAALVA